MGHLASAAATQPARSEPARICVWEPTPKQTQFLACADWEALYGGAAGGGKSDAMLMDGWCIPYGGIDNKNHKAVIFRKSYPELKDLIARARDLFPSFIPRIKYNKTDHMFTAPSGATFEFAYCENDDDRFRYRGRNWNWGGFEELTIWATDVVYQYIKSRIRTVDRTLPCFVRSTTNPDGPGQKWVMTYFGIQEEGKAACIEEEQEFEELQPDGSWKLVPRIVRRRFIPARLEDNPYLRGTGYRERLNELPPEDRDALLRGLWTGNRIKGAYFFKEMQAVRAEGRMRTIPHLKGQPVNTFWDLGWNDTTALWFHQYSALANRFLMAYEASGEVLAHFAALLTRLSIERGYVYGTHYLPHDADNKSLQTGKSALEMLKELLPGHRFVVVPRVEQKLLAIQQARAAFPTCWFDEDDCADGIAALDAYRKTWNRKQEIFTDDPVHDRFSNYADAFQTFGQGFATPLNGGIPNNRRSKRGEGDWRTA